MTLFFGIPDGIIGVIMPQAIRVLDDLDITRVINTTHNTSGSAHLDIRAEVAALEVEVAALQASTYLNSLAYIDRVKAILGSSVIGYWPLNESAGATVVDNAFSRHDIAYMGNAGLGAVGIGDGLTAANLNGAGDIDAYTAAIDSAFKGDTYSVLMWAAMNNASSWHDGIQYVIHVIAAGVGVDYYYQIRENATGLFAFLSRRGATLKTLEIIPPQSARWFNVAFTGSLSNDSVIAYINGTRQKAIATGIGGAWTGALNSIYTRFGASTTATYRWPGRMAHILMSDETLDDESIWKLADAPGQIIFDGDSRTDTKLWTAECVEDATPTGLFAYGGYGVANFASSGKATGTMLEQADASIDTLIHATNPGNNVIIVWAGVNDYTALTAQQIYNNLRDYCIGRKAAGYNKVIICTEIDAVVAGWTAKYQALNVLLLADHSFADGLANLGGDVRLQNHSDLTYFDADGTHLTAAGYEIVRSIVAPQLALVL